MTKHISSHEKVKNCPRFHDAPQTLRSDIPLIKEGFPGSLCRVMTFPKTWFREILLNNELELNEI